MNKRNVDGPIGYEKVPTADVKDQLEKDAAPTAAPGSGVKSNQVTEVLSKIVPILLKIQTLINLGMEKSAPWVEKAVEAWGKLQKFLEPYGPNHLLKMATGVGMMFFGGYYITTIAVVEAINQGGRENLVKNLKKLQEQARAVRVANEHDNLVDDDNDGIPDVQQVSKQELSMRKMMLFLRACDPNVVSEAFGNLYAILIAVTATLQVKFARAISLGTSLGGVLSKTATKYLVPPLKETLPEDVHKWIPPFTTYACKLVGVSIAFSVERILSTIHTAIRGARLATDGFTEWCESRNLHHLSDGKLDDLAAFGLAGLGIYAQLWLWHSLPLPFRLLFFPVSIVEWFLSTLVSFQVSAGTVTPGQASVAPSDLGK